MSRDIHQERQPMRLTLCSFYAFLYLCLVFGSNQLHAEHWRVYLQNKGISPFVEGSELYKQTRQLLSDKCLKRRLKVLPAQSVISIEDAPLYQPYIDDIKKTGARILLQLRWNNYVVVDCDSSVAQSLRSKAYVRDLSVIGEYFKKLSIGQQPEKVAPQRLVDTSCGLLRYGPSFFQNHLLHSDEFHSIGELGTAATIGILDNGFRYTAHDCFQHMRNMGAYDFVYNDTTVYNDSLDVGSQDGHGTATLSVICGFLPDSLIGIAPDASIYMAKTENMRSETRGEEDNYAAAIEWLEGVGVDITTSSVGYRHLDSLEQSYSYDMLDGKSTICDMALNRATALGVLCCTAAGNEGGDEKSLITPGDADSVITVGAVSDDSLNVPSWSSKGPNSSGLLKPDVMALGAGVIGATLGTRSDIGRQNGTSFATPAIAGGVALLISQFPELRPYEIRQLLYRHSSASNKASNLFGYGVPNFMDAATDFGIVVSPLLSYPAIRTQYFVFSVRSAFPIQSLVLSISTDNGSHFTDYPLEKTNIAYQYLARVPLVDQQNFVYSLKVTDSQRSRRIPQSGYASLKSGESQIPCGVNPLDFPASVDDDLTTLEQLPSAVAYGTQSIEWLGPSNPQVLVVYDALGRRICSAEASAYNGVYRVPTSGLQRGLYTLSIVSGSSVASRPLLIY